jgi:hypothetical protein
MPYRVAQYLETVRVWHDGEQWKWTPADKPAPPDAELAKRYRDGGQEVIYIDRGDSGSFVRGAVRT